MKISKIIILSIVGVVVLAGFYWFGLKPSLAYKHCGEEAYNYLTKTSSFPKNKSEHDVLIQLTEWKFFNCINKRGIK